jgi:hypothetical protein
MDFTLPAKTQTGQNTFGVNLNSSVWTLYGQYCIFPSGCGDNPSGIYYSTNKGSLLLTVDRVLKDKSKVATSETFNFSFDSNFNSSGIYDVKLTENYSNITLRDNLTEKTYSCIPDRPTIVLNVTKLDTTNKIFSGEFSGTLFSIGKGSLSELNLSDSIVLTDGRFDIKLK